MMSLDGGWSLNVVYIVSSDGASIYIMLFSTNAQKPRGILDI